MKNLILFLIIVLCAFGSSAQNQLSDSLTIEQRVDSLERNLIALQCAFDFATLNSDIQSLTSSIQNEILDMKRDIYLNKCDSKIRSNEKQLFKIYEGNLEDFENRASELNYQFALDLVMFHFSQKNIELILNRQIKVSNNLKIAKGALDYMGLCIDNYR